MKLNNLIESSFDTDPSTEKLRELKNQKKKKRYELLKRKTEKTDKAKPKKEESKKRYFREQLVNYIKQYRGAMK